METEITTVEAAKIIGVMPRQVRWYYDKGLLRGRMIAGRLVFVKGDVEAFEKPKKTGRPPTKKPQTAAAKPSAAKSEKGPKKKRDAS